MACLKEETVKNGYPIMTEYNSGGWNVGEQAQASQERLGRKVVERLRLSVHMSANILYTKNANQINFSANQIEN